MATPPAISNPTQDVLDDDNTNFGRSKFACRDDIILLTQVVLASPWAAGHKKIMAAWEEIAKNCARQPNFGLKKRVSALKTRFSLLMETFRKDEMASMRKSGVPEDFEEREVLLTDIKTRIDDYVEVDAARKDTDKKKKEGIETSGLMLRQLAMGEKQECFQKNESGHHIRKLAWLKAFYLPSRKV
ncbi:hypothetical protein AeMF1_018705 [Aphanomyces euteiches]|nr:hypothetical protein AeMF1_018705 [Aphanomyces euteiches]